MLLVFPIENRKEPHSLWSVLHPRSAMRWEWDDDGDNRVAELWHLRTELSTSRKVVYSKWFRGRATFFSREVFTAMLRALGDPATPLDRLALPPNSRELLRILESDSPLSTKELRRASGLTGKLNEAAYARGLAGLWTRLLAVAFGEVEDGAFPSLAVGATRVLFEDLWESACDLTVEEAEATILRVLGRAGGGTQPFYRQYLAARKRLGAGPDH